MMHRLRWQAKWSGYGGTMLTESRWKTERSLGGDFFGLTVNGSDDSDDSDYSYVSEPYESR